MNKEKDLVYYENSCAITLIMLYIPTAPTFYRPKPTPLYYKMCAWYQTFKSFLIQNNYGSLHEVLQFLLYERKSALPYLEMYRHCQLALQVNAINNPSAQFLLETFIQDCQGFLNNEDEPLLLKTTL